MMAAFAETIRAALTGLVRSTGNLSWLISSGHTNANYLGARLYH